MSAPVLNSVSPKRKLSMLNEPAWCIVTVTHCHVLNCFCLTWSYLQYYVHFSDKKRPGNLKKSGKCVFQNLDVLQEGVKCAGFAAFKIANYLNQNMFINYFTFTPF